jgi:hypothetical protein
MARTVTGNSFSAKIMKSPSLGRAVIRKVVKASSIGSYQFRYGIGAVNRPNYAYLIYHAARLAKLLGHKSVSVVEFGVAGGDGLLAMEYHAENIEKLTGVGIELYGFDTGAGLPPLDDYRDLPYHWKPGFFKMDVPALQSKLKRARLVLGDIRDTIHSFTERFNPAPIGAISYDLDFYSSTVAAFTLLDAPAQFLLPRMPIYFDDVIGDHLEFYNDFIGVRLAIDEFNAAHATRKLSPMYYLTATDPTTRWHHQIWSFHAFDHPQYGQFASDENQQLPL